MAALPLAILALAAAPAGAVSLQAQEDPCACRNWKEVYASGDVSCGSGSEFFFATGDTTPTVSAQGLGRKKFQRMVCDEFYTKLDDSPCLNINLGHDEGTWCYTSPECKKLNIGAKVPNSRVAWKKCKGDRDFRSMHPLDLFNYAQSHDLWFAYLEKLAYTGERAAEGLTVPVKDFEGSFPLNLGGILLHYKTLGKPFFFDTNGNGTVPHVLVYGDNAWEVAANNDADELHPGTRNVLRCLIGC